MKRFLLGFTVLSSVVGVGAVAAFYGHDLLAAHGAPQPETPPAPAHASRDLTPRPIPLAGATTESAADDAMIPSNPFAARSVDAERTADDLYAETTPRDRYGRTPATAETSEDTATPQEPAHQMTADSLTGDIPRASQVGAASDVIPAAGYSDEERYAERTVSATEPEDIEPARAPESEFDEPRALAPVTTRAAVDRYGRPVTAATPQPAPDTAAADMDATEIAPADDRFSAGDIAPADTMAPAQQSAAGAAALGAFEPQADNSDIAGEEGTGRPGDPRLSGAQAPTLTIEKVAPPEIQIGKPAKFQIKVRNTGAVIAQGVEVHDMVPQGTQLISTTPDATRGAGGELIWDLGALKPGNEQTIELELMPTEEGEIGSVATVHFRAEASVRTVATKPMLEMEVTGPEQVMKGQPVLLNIKISNPGSGAASGIVLSETVPKELTHPAGQELEFDVGTLKPGESRQLQLSLTAAEAGNVTNMLTARGDGNLQTEAQAEFEVIAPQLEVSLAGPKRRYLERNATHNISVSNPGTASAKDIELVAVLPRELQFVSANNNGQFDAASHSVYWSLAELPPQETGTVTLTTLPLQAGDAKLLIKSRAQQNLADEREEVVAIDGLAALNFQLSDASDPIEVHGQTTYEVRVHNQGTKAAGNLQLVAQLPPEMKAVSAEGPVRYRIEGQRVVFEPLKQLGAKAETTYKVTAEALEPGDLRLQIQITTDEIREPITREESTRVYGNE